MEKFVRFALYYLPDRDDPLYVGGTEWLGWDVHRGRPVQRPDFGIGAAAMERLTAEPRRYGFHGTVRPPMRLAEGRHPKDVARIAAAAAEACPRFGIPPLQLGRIGGCIALLPERECGALAELSRLLVADLDGLRAQPSESELAARRAAGLSAAEERMLVRWGYPYVDETYRFHMTLTSVLGGDDIAIAEESLARAMAPVLGRSIECRAVALVGEGEDGLFRFIRRFDLQG